MPANTRALAAALFIATLSPLPAQAALITTDAGLVSPVTTTPGYSDLQFGPFVAPVAFGNGISFTSAQPEAVYGNSFFGLVGNGWWEGRSFVGINSIPGALRFDLGGVFAAVGGEFNYATGAYGARTLRALDAGGNVLESYDIAALAPISTPGARNEGAFRGIQRASADIRFFEIDGAYMLLGNLTTAGPGTSVVPVPASLPLMASGLLALFAWQRRRTR